MGYICCLCGNAISREDRAAVQFAVSNLWRLDKAVQSLQAHSACAEKAITAAPFDPDILTGS